MADRTRHHRRAVGFFWGLVIAAAAVSITGNIAGALGSHIPPAAIRVGTAAVPPLLMLAVIEGIGLAVRAGASGRTYRIAIMATAAIGAGAFVLSFRALRELLITTGTPPMWAWLYPVIVDVAIAVGTMMLVALGERPADVADDPVETSDAETSETITRTVLAVQPEHNGHPLAVQPEHNGHPHPTHELKTAKVTTQTPETIATVLAAHRTGSSINAAAKAAGVNHRTAARIIKRLSPTP